MSSKFLNSANNIEVAASNSRKRTRAEEQATEATEATEDTEDTEGSPNRKKPKPQEVSESENKPQEVSESENKPQEVSESENSPEEPTATSEDLNSSNKSVLDAIGESEEE